MKNKKATASLIDYLLAAGGVIIFLTVAVILTKQYSASAQVNSDVENFASIQRAKSVINALSAAERGRVTETFVEKAKISVTNNATGTFLSIGRFSEKMDVQISSVEITTDKIVLVKPQGKPIEISAG